MPLSLKMQHRLPDGKGSGPRRLSCLGISGGRTVPRYPGGGGTQPFEVRGVFSCYPIDYSERPRRPLERSRGVANLIAQVSMPERTCSVDGCEG